MTWGAASYGGDSGAVQDQLRNAQQIQASRGAFAAIVGDDSVVTWGSDPRNCTDVEQLKASEHPSADVGQQQECYFCPL